MSADFHLFLRLMIRCDCEFFRSAFVVLEAICPLTFVEAVVIASANDIGANRKNQNKGFRICVSERIPSSTGLQYKLNSSTLL